MYIIHVHFSFASRLPGYFLPLKMNKENFPRKDQTQTTYFLHSSSLIKCIKTGIEVAENSICRDLNGQASANRKQL